MNEDPSAKKVTIRPLPSGKASVNIDDGEDFVLDGIVWRTLEILIQDHGVDPGGFVDWKATGEIRCGLKRQLGRPVTERALIQNIRRLRNALAEAGYGRGLVRNHKHVGYRFNLRRTTENGDGS